MSGIAGPTTNQASNALSSGPSALMSDDSQYAVYLDELKNEEALESFTKT